MYEQPRIEDAAAHGQRPCVVRIDAAGVWIAGMRTSVPDAVRRCEAAGHAEVTVTEGAPASTLAELLVALGTKNLRRVGALPRNVGPDADGPFRHFENVQTYDDLYTAQLKHLRDVRGADFMQAEPGMWGGARVIPRSTNGDVIALADYWSGRLASVKRAMGHAEVAARWARTVADVDALARPGSKDATYAKNNAFWRELQHVAVQVAAADEAPSKWDLAAGAIVDSISHLPETIGQVASEGAGLVSGAAQTVGKAANEAGKALFSGFGTPLLIGVGLLGLLLIRRGNASSDNARQD